MLNRTGTLIVWLYDQLEAIPYKDQRWHLLFGQTNQCSGSHTIINYFDQGADEAAIKRQMK